MSVRKEELLFVCLLSEKTFCLQETPVCFACRLHLTTACVRRETPPPPDALYMLLNPLLCPQNPFFSPSPTQKNHPVLLFFARLNVLAVQTGVQFQPLHMNAPRPFRVGSVSSRLLCASGSGKQSLLSSSLLRGHCVIPYMDVG